MIVGLVSGIGWFVVFLIGHLAFFRCNPETSRAAVIVRFLVIALLGHLATVTIMFTLVPMAETIRQGGATMALVWGWLLLGSLFILYMPFYYTIATSLSVQTMIILEGSPDRASTVKALREHFVSRQLVGDRLQLMVRNGYLRSSVGGYSLTHRGRRVATIFLKLKQLWVLGAGG